MSTTCPEPRPAPHRDDGGAAERATNCGFTMVSALFILVVLSLLGAALAKVSQRQHLDSALDLQEAQAYQAAQAGLEWAAWQVLRNPAPPAAAPACFGATTFSPGATLAAFSVTVTCTRTPATGALADGATALVFYQLSANACNAASGGTCPNSGTPAATYVERQLSWTVSR